MISHFVCISVPFAINVGNFEQSRICDFQAIERESNLKFPKLYVGVGVRISDVPFIDFEKSEF